MLARLLSTSLFKMAGVYTLSNVLNAAVPFVLIPILTRYLSPADYGIVSMFQVATGIAVPFIGLSVYGAISRQYVERTSSELAEYVGSCLCLLLTTASLAGAAVFFLAPRISRVSSIREDWVWTMVLFALGQSVIQILLALWQMQQRPKSYALFSVGQTAANAALSVFFVVGLGMAWQGRIIAQLVSVVLFTGLALLFLVREKLVRFRPRRAYLCNALAFGGPLIPHAVGGWATDMIDRVFITNLVGVADTGIYSLGYQIAMIIGIVEASFNQAWVPYFFRELKKDDHEVKCKLVKFAYSYCLALAALAVALSAAAHIFMPLMVGGRFHEAEKYVLWIALGYSFNGMYKMMANYFFYFERTSVLATITAASSLVNVGLTYLLVRSFGVSGAAYATTCSYLIMFLMTWSRVNSVSKMPWLYFRAAREY